MLFVRLIVTLAQKGIERWLVVFRELLFYCFTHDAIVGDDVCSVCWPLNDKLSAYPPQQEANKTMERNAQGVGSWFCFHSFISPFASLISSFALCS